MEVEPLQPTPGPLKQTIDSMSERGIRTLYGRWLIEGAPRVLLIDTSTGYRWLDEWKGDLWNTAGIPSPASDAETNEAIVFGYLVAWFLGEVSFFYVTRALSILTVTVSLKRNETRCNSPLSRMARWSRDSLDQKTSYGCNNHIHDSCHFTG